MIFYFHPYLGKSSNLTNIFQVDWNHQLVNESFRICLHISGETLKHSLLTNLPEEQLDDSLALLQQENHRQNEQRFNGMAPVVLAAAAAAWFFDVELGYMDLSV